MRVLMLGWEFPPYISGGLGTACRGLTDALQRHQARVLFVLPRAVDSPDQEDFEDETTGSREAASDTGDLALAPVFSEINSPYAVLGQAVAKKDNAARTQKTGKKRRPRRRSASSVRVMGVGSEDGYDGDLTGKIRAFADRCMNLTRRELFDVIHAHEWMTFPAAVGIARFSGRPLVVHVHATEYDRSGEDNLNGTIYEIERFGMHAATRVIAVSHRTRQTIIERYGVPAEKVVTVHNGIDFDKTVSPRRRSPDGEKTVLFLGRITMQKGPEFFVRAAKRVAERVDNVRFVIAGSGDLMPRVVTLSRRLGLEDRIEFPGFLRGEDVAHAYRRSDVFVMPSVSEPFGLTALEAVCHGVPVVLSKTSGAAEVLARGSLKVDFWDTEMMAKMIVALLEYPLLADTLRRESTAEVRGLTWDVAARKCTRLYNELTAHRSTELETIGAARRVTELAGELCPVA